MIRIDLGADGLQKKGGGGANAIKGLLSKIKIPSFGRGGGEGRMPAGGTFQRPRRGVIERLGNLGGTVVLILALAASYLPHMAFLQLKERVIAEHEAEKKKLQDDLNEIGRQIAKLAPFQKELESYEAQKKLVKERLEVIRQLLAQRGTPVNVMDAIGQSLPQRTWIRSLDFDMKSAKPGVNLGGEALSNDDIADYVDKLSESVYLTEVNLEGVTAAKLQAANTVEVKGFTLQIVPKGLRGTAAQKPNAPPAPAKAPAAAPSAAKAPVDTGTALRNAAKAPQVPE